MHLSVPPIPYKDLFPKESLSNPVNSTENMRRRIQQGLTFRQERAQFFHSKKLQHFSVSPEEYKLTKEAEDLLRLAFEHFSISARAYHKILRIGRTIADLDQSITVGEVAIAEALQYRALEH